MHTVSLSSLPEDAGLVASYVTELKPILHGDRLERYRPPIGDDLSMVVHYLWNTELSESLYHSLGALEVSLRNTIHATLTAHHSCADWYGAPNFLHSKQPEQVTEVKQRIVENKKLLGPGRVIAGLEFGFWTTLPSAGWARSGVAIGKPLFHQEFPHAPQDMQFRKKVHRRFDTIR